MRRAAAWDGAFPIPRDRDLSKMLSVAETADVIAFVEQARRATRPFDYVHAGLMSGDRAVDVDTAASYAALRRDLVARALLPGTLLDRSVAPAHPGWPAPPRLMSGRNHSPAASVIAPEPRT